MITKYLTYLFACLSLMTSFHAKATLTTYSSGNENLVYSSVSNVTWVGDLNLYQTMLGQHSYENLVSSIIAASPVITNVPNFYDSPSFSGGYQLSNSDFNLYKPQMSWWGAQGFINYLNLINYGGTDKWRLPTVTDIGQPGCDYSTGGTDCGSHVATNGATPGDELAEIYFQEFHAEGAGNNACGFPACDYGIPKTNLFLNDEDPQFYFNSGFWTGTEVNQGPYGSAAVFVFDPFYAIQYADGKINNTYFTWAVTDGFISTVPENKTYVMLIAGLSLLALTGKRRKH